MERSATPPTEPGDETLLAELRRVLAAIDPVPKHVGAAGRLAIEWRPVDAELAELVHDSVVDGPPLGTRSAGPRALTFATPALTIELEAERDADDGLRIAGRLVPPQAAEIVVRSDDDVVATRSDEHGRFDVGGLPDGPLRLRLRLDDARIVETVALTL